MKNIYLLLLPLLMMSCSLMEDDATRQKREREAAFQVFQAFFQPIDIDTTDHFPCESLSFGEHQENPFSRTLLSDSLIRAAIDSQLLAKAVYVPEEQHFALGRLSFADSVDAFLIGAYSSEFVYSSHMFLYDQQAKQFTYTQSLNYVIKGGDFDSRRDAWLMDLNQDLTPDVVYNMNQSYMPADTSQAWVIKDSVHIEVWDGFGFTDFKSNDLSSLKLQLAIDLNEEELMETEDSSDEYF